MNNCDFNSKTRPKGDVFLVWRGLFNRKFCGAGGFDLPGLRPAVQF